MKYAEQQRALEKAESLRKDNWSDATKKIPDLVNAFAMLKATELLAQQQFRNTKDQKNVVDLARETLAKSIAQNKIIPPVLIKERVQSVEQKRENMLER